MGAPTAPQVSGLHGADERCRALSECDCAVVIGEPTALRVIASGNPNVITPVKFVSIEKAMVVTVNTTLVKFLCDYKRRGCQMGTGLPPARAAGCSTSHRVNTADEDLHHRPRNTSVTAADEPPAARGRADCGLAVCQPAQ